MIAITAILKTTPENKAKVLAMITSIIAETRKEMACKRYELHHNETDFIIWEEWQNQEGLDLHNKSVHLQSFGKEIGSLILGEIQIYKTDSFL